MKAIVTGHTRGLGAAIAEQLLRRGIAVLGLARATNADLAARYPELFCERSLDLADSDALLTALAGDTVTAGQKLGTVGTVGCECAEESHIHVEVKQGESYLDPAKLPE